VCSLAQDFLQEQDFPERKLLQRGSNVAGAPKNPQKNALLEILI
jgi:hypothetical protein